jgi:hypothetical protein
MQHTSACDDCIVTVLLDGPVRRLEMHEEEVEALGHLAEAGLVAPIRLVPRTYDPEEATG